MSIRAIGVFAGYGAIDVLRGVDFVAQSGSVTALLGPNGCGKTTLLRCLSGQLTPKRGEVSANGSSLSELSCKQRAQIVSVVPQSEEPIFDFTVRELVEMGLYPWLPASDAELRIQAAINTMRLGELCDSPMTQISGGEKQRAILARALVQDTPVVLLDEPTAHMDVGFQIASLSHLREQAQQGKTIVVALHDLNLAAGFADHAALMLNGVIVAQGAVKPILEGPEIERVYGATFDRFHDAKHDRLILAPEFIPKTARVANPRRVHLIGGGGTAAALLTELWQLGHTLSLGVAHQGDSDCAAAERLGVPVHSVAAFSSIADSDLAATVEMADDAELVVYCSPPIGDGNFANLELAQAIMALGKPVLVISQLSEEWDFTGGRAEAVLASLLSGGAKAINASELISDFSAG